MSNYELSSSTGLPHGAYEVYFAVDKDMDGVLDKNSSFHDHGTINRMTMFLPDSGQTQSYTNTFGEDSDYTINPHSFTDNGDGAIIDNITGLVWQKEDDNIRRDWQSAGDYCENLALAGNTDWRLPAVVELNSIMDYGKTFPAIDTFYFPGTEPYLYWTSELWVNHPQWMWIVGFTAGGITPAPYWDISFTRCVRGEMDWPDSNNRFTDNGNGTVTDSFTGLVWQQVEERPRLWEKAIRYCENLSLGGHADWRLPNATELSSLVDRTREMTALDKRYFPNVESEQYWTSTTWDNSEDYAFIVEFGSGLADTLVKPGYWFNVRCVRGEPRKG
ncbi:MAG: DUF1566 domain-containing protein [Deltaproteobacteria bacterium]|nr:DUF1566 domain-containing protein [Deltaproteobacteria bacterium]